MPAKKKTSMKGGSPASDHVMRLMDTPVRVDGMMVLPLNMKGGSGASNSVMSLVQPVCACDANLPAALGKMAGTVTDFHLTTGGAKKKGKGTRKVNRPRRVKGKKTGGSVPYYINMKGICNQCNGVQIIPAFPGGGKKKKTMKGGSGWLGVHNSRSANAMSPEQFSAFTKTGAYIQGGQNAECVFKGPMFQ
jgi:hypothetical protein